MSIDEQGIFRESDGRHPQCPRCKRRWEVEFEIKQTGPHWAKLRCKACGCVWFPPKPDRDKAKRPSRQAKLVKRYSRGYCELCLIPADKIPSPEILTAHHVQEFHDAGDESRENIWILCSRCERLVHHQRTYIGHLYHANANRTDATQCPAVDESVGELDQVEDGEQERGQADEGADPGDGDGGSEFDRPGDLDEF
jgi:hypothetical protein